MSNTTFWVPIVIDEDVKTLALHPETRLHIAADAQLKHMKTSVHYALALARSRVSPRNPAAALQTVPSWLEATIVSVLPATLLKCVEAGGVAAAGMLGAVLKAATFNPDQPRDEQGRWSGDGLYYHGTSSANVDSILKEGIKPSNNPEHGYMGTVISATPDITEAKEYAHTKGTFDKKGAVLEVHIPKDYVKGTSKIIPKEWIKAVHEPVGTKWVRRALSDDLKAATFNPSQPRDDQGQWTTGQGSERLHDIAVRPEAKVSEAWLQTMHDAIASQPAWVQATLHDENISVLVTHGERSSYGSGLIQINDNTPKDDIANTLSHEIGHALDDRLRNPSTDKEFSKAFIEDTRSLKPEMPEIPTWMPASANSDAKAVWTRFEKLENHSKISDERRKIYDEADRGKTHIHPDVVDQFANARDAQVRQGIGLKSTREAMSYFKRRVEAFPELYANTVGHKTTTIDLKTVMPRSYAVVEQWVAGHAQKHSLRGAEEFRTAADLTMRFDVHDPKAVQWAKDHAAELAKGISETTRDAIKAAIADALETGEDAYHGVLAAIGDETRADLIARTETMRAASEGQRLAWDQAVDKGLLTGDERRVWITTEDACPLCEPLDGKTAALDGEYPGDGGDGPPLHPRCRCTEGIT